MPQHGPADRGPEPDPPGNRHIPPKLTMQLPRTPAARHRPDGPAGPVEVVAGHGPSGDGRIAARPARSSIAVSPHQHPRRVSGDPALTPPAGPGRADGIQRDVPRRRGPVIRRPRAASPSYVSRKSGAEQATCRPDQEQALAAGSPSPDTAWPLEVLAWPLAICGRVIAIHMLIVGVTPDDVPVDQAGLRAATVGMLEGPLIPILSQGRAARAPPWTANLMPEPGM